MNINNSVSYAIPKLVATTTNTTTNTTDTTNTTNNIANRKTQRQYSFDSSQCYQRSRNVSESNGINDHNNQNNNVIANVKWIIGM